MATVRLPPSIPPMAGHYNQGMGTPPPVPVVMEISSDSEDTENIPYHAREHARPFTYGNLPKGFTTSELNHVELSNDVPDSVIVADNRQLPIFPASPSFVRKSLRPSVSPSPPVLRKMPTREDFERMLSERHGQVSRQQSKSAAQAAKNVTIQKDLDELYERLNKQGILQSAKEKTSQDNRNNVVTSVETINLQELSAGADTNPGTSNLNRYEQGLAIAESKRPKTPSFPEEPKTPLDDRCVSPYTLQAAASTSHQQTSNKVLALPPMTKSVSKSPAKEVRYHENVIINEIHEVEPHLVKFAKDYSEFWYKPHITREDAIALLKNASPGTFLIRNSTTYKNAYGLVLRVEKAPHNIAPVDTDQREELVRHFLLEPTALGVRLKGCAIEPIFSSLSAFVYQHSINPLALPCKLIIPNSDLLYSSRDTELLAAQKYLMAQGAACNVLYLLTCDMESLTGDEAIRKAVCELYAQRALPHPVEVHFKVSEQGITLTDNTRRHFFRRHYAPQNISHFNIDPENRFWSVSANDEGVVRTVNKTIFAFVARPMTGAKDNQCHVFCDLAAGQPASAIVSFANKILPMDKHLHKML